MTYLHEAKGPIETLQAWVANVQVPKPVLAAVERLAAMLHEPAPRVASVTPLPFAPPAGCTCPPPLPVLHGDGCPLQTMDRRDTRIEELEFELADLKADVSPARIATLAARYQGASSSK